MQELQTTIPKLDQQVNVKQQPKTQWLQSKRLYNTLAIVAIILGLFEICFSQISSRWGEAFTWIQREVPARMHFISGPLVLILGIFQFSQKLRKEKPQLHRWIGRFYVLFMLISIGSIYAIVWHSAYGLVPQISLFLLNCMWLVSLIIAVYYIAVKKDIVQHKYWMIRNYALTSSAITLRFILIFFIIAEYEEVGYKIATTNAYIWNMCFGEYIIYKMKKEQQQLSQSVKLSPITTKSQVSVIDNQQLHNNINSVKINNENENDGFKEQQ